MKDIVISGRRIARELWIYAGCVLAALCVNVYAIAAFHTQWKELFTTLHITLSVALVFYGALALLRMFVFLGMRVFRRKAV
ncbi:MAG: hypothetical protein ACP5E2_13585 [Terracidiphilus sp.]